MGRGRIRLGGDEAGDDDDGAKGWKYKRRPVGKVLLSWNASLALTLTASLAVLVWRFVVYARGRMLRDEEGCAARLLAADWSIYSFSSFSLPFRPFSTNILYHNSF